MSKKIYNFNIELLHYLMENKEILDYTKLSTNDMRLILSYCEILEKKIDKAIEYLKSREDDNSMCSVCSVMTDDLLDILKGDDK